MDRVARLHILRVVCMFWHSYRLYRVEMGWNMPISWNLGHDFYALSSSSVTCWGQHPTDSCFLLPQLNIDWPTFACPSLPSSPQPWITIILRPASKILPLLYSAYRWDHTVLVGTFNPIFQNQKTKPWSTWVTFFFLTKVTNLVNSNTASHAVALNPKPCVLFKASFKPRNSKIQS